MVILVIVVPTLSAPFMGEYFMMSQIEVILLSLGIQEMEEIYPANTPDPNDTHAAIMYRAGQRSVVEWLTKRISENN